MNKTAHSHTKSRGGFEELGKTPLYDRGLIRKLHLGGWIIQAELILFEVKNSLMRTRINRKEGFYCEG